MRSTWDFTQILILPAQETTFEDVPLATRQFEYNLMFNLRPPKSLWRPTLPWDPPWC